MRERLLAALVALTLLTVMLYGIPRAFVRADVVAEEARVDVARSAQFVAELLKARRSAGLSAELPDGLLPERDTALLHSTDGVQVLAGPPLEQTPPDSTSARVPVGGNSTVEVVRPRAAVREDVVSALLPILRTGLAALAIAVLASVLLATRLARPFQLLAARAAAVGRGEVVDVPRQPVREAEAIAAALRQSSARVAVLLTRQREFARNASHQLRTPLTAMRLRVEDVSLWPQTPPDVGQELQHVLSEIDRLSDTVTALLAFSREQRTDTWERQSVDEVAKAAVERWRPVADARGRSLQVTESAAEPVPLPRVAVDQVLDVLVDNALKHGQGTVSLAGDVDTAGLHLVVRDEGQGVQAVGVRELSHGRQTGRKGEGEGIGLALCADLALSLGGELRLAGHSPTTFELVLPVPAADTAP